MKIETYEDLKTKRRLLRLRLAQHEAELKEDLQWFKEELEPIHAASKFVNKLLIRKDGIINNAIGRGVGGVLKKTVLSNSSWLTRLIIPGIAKNLVSNLILDHKEEILFGLKKWIQHLRTKNSNNHYESSTAADISNS